MKRERALIQGAMDIELNLLLEALEDKKEEEHAGFLFYTGTIKGQSVIICKTGMGIMNGALATATGLHYYKPDVVINQGTAGGHADMVHTGDLVICEKAEYLNGFRMPVKGAGEGSDSLQWTFDEKMGALYASQELVEYFSECSYDIGNVYVGCIGSGDIYSRETDRIRWIHEQKNNLCEDMETYAVYETCRRMGVPCISLRVISNHEVWREPFSEKTAEELQKFIIKAWT